jgi:hypothetical protein
MKPLALLTMISLCLLQSGCMSSPSPSPSPSPPPAPTSMGFEPSVDVPRGPWNADRLKAAEAIRQTPARTELDRQRSALASAYIQWGEALFSGLEPVRQSVVPAGEPVAPMSSEASGTPSSVSPLPPLWYWQEKQQQDLDKLLQQQRDLYYRERQPSPQFPRPPICNSYQVGGQVYTQCR